MNMSGGEINPNEDYAHTLKLLKDWGYEDMRLNRIACQKTNGILASAIEYLSSGKVEESAYETQRRKSASSSSPFSVPVQLQQQQQQRNDYLFPKLTEVEGEKVLQIGRMGFTDEGKIRHALTLSKWSTEGAIERLLSDHNSTLQSSFSALNGGNTSVPSNNPTLPSRTQQQYANPPDGFGFNNPPPQQQLYNPFGGASGQQQLQQNTFFNTSNNNAGGGAGGGSASRPNYDAFRTTSFDPKTSSSSVFNSTSSVPSYSYPQPNQRQAQLPQGHQPQQHQQNNHAAVTQNPFLEEVSSSKTNHNAYKNSNNQEFDPFADP